MWHHFRTCSLARGLYCDIVWTLRQVVGYAESNNIQQHWEELNLRAWFKANTWGWHWSSNICNSLRGRLGGDRERRRYPGLKFWLMGRNEAGARSALGLLLFSGIDASYQRHFCVMAHVIRRLQKVKLRAARVGWEDKHVHTDSRDLLNTWGIITSLALSLIVLELFQKF